MKYVLVLCTICNVLALPPCNDDILMGYLANMQIINPEMIINLCTLNSLPKLCDKIAENLNHLSTYLQSCAPFEHSLFTKLIQGVDKLYNKLCTNTKFATDFRNHHNCFHTFRDAFVACNGPQDWIENSNNEIICNSYKHIVNCYYNVTLAHCGKIAAKNMAELTIEVINSVLVIKCDNINQRYKEVLEMDSGATIGIFQLRILITILILKFSFTMSFCIN